MTVTWILSLFSQWRMKLRLLALLLCALSARAIGIPFVDDVIDAADDIADDAVDAVEKVTPQMVDDTVDAVQDNVVKPVTDPVLNEVDGDGILGDDDESWVDGKEKDQSAEPMSTNEAIALGAAVGGGGTVALVGLGLVFMRFSFARNGREGEARGRVSVQRQTQDANAQIETAFGTARFSN